MKQGCWMKIRKLINYRQSAWPRTTSRRAQRRRSGRGWGDQRSEIKDQELEINVEEERLTISFCGYVEVAVVFCGFLRIFKVKFKYWTSNSTMRKSRRGWSDLCPEDQRSNSKIDRSSDEFYNLQGVDLRDHFHLITNWGIFKIALDVPLCYLEKKFNY